MATASEQIDKQIADLGGWRGGLLARLRTLIHEADPNIVEEWKWGTGVFTDHGMVCAIAGFKDHVKLNFFQGASLQDPHGLFNAGLDAKATRSIDFHEGEAVDEPSLRALIQAAVAINAVKS